MLFSSSYFFEPAGGHHLIRLSIWLLAVAITGCVKYRYSFANTPNIYLSSICHLKGY